MTDAEKSVAAFVGPSHRWWSELSAGRLSYQRCGDCRGAVFYPRVLCPDCGSRDLNWEISAGVGEIYSVTLVPTREGTSNIVLVDLDEGFRMMSIVDGLDPEDIAIGDRVHFQVSYETGSAKATFVPTKGHS